MDAYGDQHLTDRRQIWAFQYKPVEVLAAAEERVEHHASREEWWIEQYMEAEEQLKEKGFEYREWHSSASREVHIVGDPDLAQRVAKCQKKKAEHREKKRLYETWARALKAKTERQPGEELELSINDVLFFGL